MKNKAILILALFMLTSCSSLTLNEENKYLRSIKLGGEWFLNNQDGDFIYYQYYPFERRHSSKQQRLREMGALWSISKLADFLNDTRYTKLADKGFRYFEGYFEYDEENDLYFVDITPEKIKLGYNAFVILTLLEIEHPKKDFYLEKFANGIIYMQNNDGKLRTFFYSDRDTGTDYYPGEALLALMSLYEYTKDDKYLETVQKAFPYYVEYFRDDKNTAFVPWQTRAYHKLYQITEDKEVLDFIFEMNDYVLDEYSPEEHCSIFEFDSIVAAVHMEGVNKAYDLAKKTNDKERADCYANFIKEGSEFILTLQITEGKKEAIGGFLGSPDSESMRVDRNQHAVLLLMDAYELLK
ncbi:MAG: hypothetical protein V3V78_01955 [Candidatus Woesearchaeota archaeon]